MLNLRKLFIDVFDPQPGETAAVLIDLPHGELRDTDAWSRRRAMAERWHGELSELGAERNFEVLPGIGAPSGLILLCPAPGAYVHER